ncbi:MAG: hypothetical protein JKX75_00450 [Gammaproteobacteria bacterium]|nr:hypothetical protein [Gammaproteobacteria bacterium]
MAAIGVAMFPCSCDGHFQIIPMVHYVAAAVMFCSLAVFCSFFLARAWKKGWAEVHVRAILDGICGLAIILSMVGMAVDYLMKDVLSNSVEQFTFYAEATGLVAFGIAWLTASRILTYLTRSDERLSVLEQMMVAKSSEQSFREFPFYLFIK